MTEEQIFAKAIEMDPAERTGYLDKMCANDPDLRSRIDGLIAAHENPDSFLNPPDAGPPPTEECTPVAESPGTVIGRYKLLEQIGEGGMGVVFVAERSKPYRQKVALKIIKPGMDSKSVMARFQAEQQTLALMDHPNIARVLDAGMTEQGRPYFVMELVRGQKITDYCDRHRLTIQERLELFTQVCQAAQHAHQKAVIHRDIKPSNVLVTEKDGKAIPKVIDFGIAKALNENSLGYSVYTRFKQVMGTPLYMSPEQTGESAVDVDTRSDVYSLGVLLYELLVGTTPFTEQDLRKAGDAEMMRIIRETVPPKPSTKINTLGSQASTVSENRRMEYSGLARTVHGDLDWIVMKALEKERARRYESASAFAADVQRYLSDEPIEARPPSTIYRLRKTAARHRVALLMTTIVMLALVLGTAVSTWQWSVAVAARREADEQREAALRAQRDAEDAKDEAEQATAKLRESLIDQAFGYAMSGDVKLTELAIQNLEMAGASPFWELLLRGLLSHQQGRMQNAIDKFKEATEEDPDSLLAWAMLSAAYDDAGQGAEHGLTVARLKHLRTPETDLEHLFKSRAKMFHEPQVAVESLRNIVERRRSWGIAHAVFADALVRLSWDHTDLERALEAAVEALNHVQLAQELLPDSPRLHATALMATLSAAHLASNDEAIETHLVESDAIARLLDEEYPQSAPREMAVYYDIREDNVKKAIDELRLALKDRKALAYEIWLRAMLYRQGEFREAAARFGSPWAEIEIAEDLKACAEKIEGRVHSLPSPHVLKIWEPLLLCVLGRRSVAEKIWKEQLTGSEPLPWNYEYPLQLFTGEWDEDRLFDEARGSRIKTSFAHFCVAHWYLEVEVNEEKAKEHFQRCVDLGVIRIDYYQLSKAMLVRLKHTDKLRWLREDMPGPPQAEPPSR